MIIKPIKTRIFKENDNLIDFIVAHLKKIPECSVLVITSKIVALAEGRVVEDDGSYTKEELIKAESDLAIPTKYVWLTIKDGMVMASAGIDESNADGKYILLPKDSFKTAKILHKELKARYKVKNLGILITDSRTMPLRAGVTGVGVGYAGFCAIKDYRGKRDIYGRKFKFSRVDVVDSLAAAAVFTMGEGSECRPLALIEKAEIEYCERISPKELLISIEDDMYGPLFSKMTKRR
jgi:coenzyme F420-0:L-glutamate ligase